MNMNVNGLNMIQKKLKFKLKYLNQFLMIKLMKLFKNQKTYRNLKQYLKFYELN